MPAGVFLGGSVASEWCAFFYRFHALQAGDTDFWKQKKVLIGMGIFHFLIPVPCLGLLYPAIMFYQAYNDLSFIRNVSSGQ